MKVRIKAIYYCLKFAVLPWWAYEKTPHYNCTYWQHLLINFRYAWVWITFKERKSDWFFECKVNGNFVYLS